MTSSSMIRGNDGLVHIALADVTLEGDLLVPHSASGVVLFVHGSGSSRFSSRNRQVATTLREGGMGTLLIDLLTYEEERADMRTGHLRFDISLLADRVAGTVDWLSKEPATRDLRVGLFGASTGGGAALVAASRLPEKIRAVVSRGGRPDLAAATLPDVKAPTLLIVGGDDVPVIAMNRAAHDQMTVERRLEIIPGASHLFEEPGTLEEVARLAGEWFGRFL